jgi:hypothetical protein
MCEADENGDPVASREPLRATARCCPDGVQLADAGGGAPSLARCQFSKPLDFSEGNDSAEVAAGSESVFI